MPRKTLLFALAALLLLPASASAVTVSRAQLSSGQLKIEGSGARSSFVSATSSASAAGGRPNVDGSFKIEASNFKAPDCKVIVSDGVTQIATPTLSGCTPTAVTPPPTTTPPPTGTCVINPAAPGSFAVGQNSAYFFTTTGCNTSLSPVQWSVVAGRVPPGMDQPRFQGQTGGGVIGTPTTEGTYTFTLKVTDSIGATDTENFTITITPPLPLVISTANTLPGATLGTNYLVSLSASGGLPGYLWTLRSGSLPSGMVLSRNQIGGTPKTRGTFTFTIRVTDSRNTSTDKTFSITVT